MRLSISAVWSIPAAIVLQGAGVCFMILVSAPLGALWLDSGVSPSVSTLTTFIGFVWLPAVRGCVQRVPFGLIDKVSHFGKVEIVIRDVANLSRIASCHFARVFSFYFFSSDALHGFSPLYVRVISKPCILTVEPRKIFSSIV